MAFKYQMANFDNSKLQLLLHQPNIIKLKLFHRMSIKLFNFI